jgi:tetratricopeptide (TPR) repeat protein/TolB-like protein
MEPDRLLETVLFTDIVGSTERAAELGDRGWRELLRDHYSLVRRELERFKGRHVSTSGDGFLATFDRPARAIGCACAIRDAVRALGLQVRSGLHAGEVEVAGKDVGGIAVNIGARVVAQAKPGEVLVSSTVRDLVAGSGFGFEDRGSHVLKGVPGEWRLYAVSGRPVRLPARSLLVDLGDSIAPSRLAQLTRKGKIFAAAVALAFLGMLAVPVVHFSTRDRVSSLNLGEAVAEGAAPGIAVLPFSVSGPGLDEWREGMVDLLSTNLDGVAGLRAIDSRTVLARWRERVQGTKSPDLKATLEIARLTGARYALVGSAVSIGTDLRLAAEIYEVRDGTSLGRAQVEGLPDSVTTLVDRLSIEILGAVPLGQREAASVNLAEITTASPPALRAYLEGEGLYRRSDFEAAIRAYLRAVEADSTFALAFYRLAITYPRGKTFDPVLAERYRERAARLADRLPEREAKLASAQLALERSALQGMDFLQHFLSSYPDDAEGWYQFGEACFMWGPQTLLDQQECHTAFSKAVELDPSFTPAYAGLIDDAFTHDADSARAATLVAAYGSLVPGTETDRLNRLALRLAFGDSVTRAGARATLDTLQLGALVAVASYLGHPRFRPLQEEVLLLRLQPNSPRAAQVTHTLFFNNFARGKFDAALEQLDATLSIIGRTTFPGWWEETLYVAYTRGMPVSDELLERDLTLSGVDSVPHRKTFYAGAYAADRGRWSDHEDAVERIRDYSRRFSAEGDSVGARFTEGMAQALEGYALWRRNRPEEAAQLLEDARQKVTGKSPLGWEMRGSVIDLNAVIRFWLAKLFFEMGRFREAERYFQSFWRDPLASYYLASIYEAQERFDHARRAYELFTIGWADADPELQPMVREARGAMARLASVIRE